MWTPSTSYHSLTITGGGSWKIHCAKKWRIGNLYTKLSKRMSLAVTSVTTPIWIEGFKDEVGQSRWRNCLGLPVSTRSLLTQVCISHSNRSGNSCSGSLLTLGTTSSQWNRRWGNHLFCTSSGDLERENWEGGSTTWLWNRRAWPSQNRQKRLLITGRRPVLSHDISSQFSGSRRSSGWLITPPTYDRGERR